MTLQDYTLETLGDTILAALIAKTLQDKDIKNTLTKKEFASLLVKVGFNSSKGSIQNNLSRNNYLFVKFTPQIYKKSLAYKAATYLGIKTIEQFSTPQDFFEQEALQVWLNPFSTEEYEALFQQIGINSYENEYKEFLFFYKNSEKGISEGTFLFNKTEALLKIKKSHTIEEQYLFKSVNKPFYKRQAYYFVLSEDDNSYPFKEGSDALTIILKYDENDLPFYSGSFLSEHTFAQPCLLVSKRLYEQQITIKENARNFAERLFLFFEHIQQDKNHNTLYDDLWKCFEKLYIKQADFGFGLTGKYWLYHKAVANGNNTDFVKAKVDLKQVSNNVLLGEVDTNLYNYFLVGEVYGNTVLCKFIHKNIQDKTIQVIHLTGTSRIQAKSKQISLCLLFWDSQVNKPVISPCLLVSIDDTDKDAPAIRMKLEEAKQQECYQEILKVLHAESVCRPDFI